MLDLLAKNATRPDGRTDMSLAVRAGLIVEAARGLDAPTHEVIDAQGLLLSPPFLWTPTFHGRNAQLWPAARHLKRNAVGGIAPGGGLKPMLRIRYLPMPARNASSSAEAQTRNPAQGPGYSF